MQSLPPGYHALILGASGAIGGAIAAQLQADPRCAQVLTLSRHSTPAIDFDKPDSIAAAAQALRPLGPWHLIVVATGMLTGPTSGPEKRLAELNATHMAASYLIHDLACDWRAGAAWFEAQLLDYDVYSNQGNWLYIAGRGTDPRGGRRFNATKQAHDHDADGTYRRMWGTA